jgi:hypothetical protein
MSTEQVGVKVEEPNEITQQHAVKANKNSQELGLKYIIALVNKDKSGDGVFVVQGYASNPPPTNPRKSKPDSKPNVGKQHQKDREES